MPLAAGCSAAISAACHPLAGDGDATMAVKWGDVTAGTASIRHCSFSNNEVFDPVSGHLYAGQPRVTK